MISKFKISSNQLENGYINRCIGRALTYAVLSAPKLRSKRDSEEYQEALVLRGLMRIWSKEVAYAIRESRK